jgi:hypothetical protein
VNQACSRPKNELHTAGIQTAFGLGKDSIVIYFAGEGGWSLITIQGLNQKLNRRTPQSKRLKAPLNEFNVCVRQLAQPQTK